MYDVQKICWFKLCNLRNILVYFSFALFRFLFLPGKWKMYNLNRGNRIIKRSQNKHVRNKWYQFGLAWDLNALLPGAFSPHSTPHAGNIYLTLRIRQGVQIENPKCVMSYIGRDWRECLHSCDIMTPTNQRQMHGRCTNSPIAITNIGCWHNFNSPPIFTQSHCRPRWGFGKSQALLIAPAMCVCGKTLVEFRLSYSKF